jgi:lipoprotein-releasing system ATP-binding protein
MTALLEARGLRKVYAGGDGQPLEVLRGLDVNVRRGEVVAVVGASGAGKSTLLHLLGALDHPSAGDIWLDGSRYADLDPVGLAEVRNRKLGFVFQFHHLLREFTALENVMLPLLIADVPPRAARTRAEELLADVGLAGRMAHRPAELSGGEQQRCAVARALVHDPTLVLADEPSGNLDHANSERLHENFFRLAREFETAVVVATHNRQLAARADRILWLEDGRITAVESIDVIPCCCASTARNATRSST